MTGLEAFERYWVGQEPGSTRDIWWTQAPPSITIEFIRDLKNAAPDKPFFLYYATGAMHAPHQVRREWIGKYKGKFDMGWDKARELILAFGQAKDPVL